MFVGLISVVFILATTEASELVATSDAAKSRSESVERYYAVFFAYQSSNNAIDKSHTFATFIKVPSVSTEKAAETRTISWCSTTGIIKLTRPAERGINKSLEETLSFAERNRLDVILCGAFEIQPELYHRAEEQLERLNSGQVQYKVVDRLIRNRAKNCISAVADLFEDNGRLDTGTLRGRDATLRVVEHLRPFYVSGHKLEGDEQERLFALLKLPKAAVRELASR
ncbi:MAG: hypothetical protein C0483_09920 [Pirellula sp.]|nr:hypothetical protein [Pirellula sp.]